MNTTATAARTTSTEGSHYYWPDGRPCYEVIGKTTGRPRPTTLADAKKLNLLPSVTTILKILHKEALVNWLIENACLAVLTTPRPPEEPLDAFVERVLHTERVQDQESQIARDRGTDMHAALEGFFKGEQIDEDLRGWIEPAAMHLKGKLPGAKFVCESCVVGGGYAGRVDLLAFTQTGTVVVDFKTAKKLPEKASWSEHRLQLSAYARAVYDQTQRPATTANLYISTVEMGKFALHENPPWQEDFENGFAPLVRHWSWATGYTPQQ